MLSTLVTVKATEWAHLRIWCGSGVALAGRWLVFPTTHAARAELPTSLGGAPASPRWPVGRETNNMKIEYWQVIPISLVLSKILQSKKCQGSIPLKLQFQYLQKAVVVHYTVIHTQLMNTLRESTCEHLSQHYAIPCGPENLPRFALSILHHLYYSVFKKGLSNLHSPALKPLYTVNRMLRPGQSCALSESVCNRCYLCKVHSVYFM